MANCSLSCKMWWILILSVIPTVYNMSIFSNSHDANRVLKVKKRANNQFLEEMKPGSLERECYEEKCDLEEANEIFETREATLNFWATYFDGDQCLSSPCVNGFCRDGIGKFDCICHHGWEGQSCTNEVTHFNCSLNNGGCAHFCTESGSSRVCSCAPGYRLDDDFHSCKATENDRNPMMRCLTADNIARPSIQKEMRLMQNHMYYLDFPCGKMKIFNSDYSARLTGAKKGRKGDSPWQALILYEKKFHCGGVLIHPSWILTAAHCYKAAGKYSVRLGEFDRRILEDTEQQISVSKIFRHSSYNPQTMNNDIALLRLSQPAVYNKYVLPICLPNYGLAKNNLTVEGTETIVTGWGNQDETYRNRTSILSFIQVPIVPQANCSEVMQNLVTSNMLCAGRLGDNQDACTGDSGGPMVTQFGDTWFLIGLVSWGEGCGRLDNFGVYTKVDHYLEWINQQITNYKEEVKEMKATNKSRKN